MKAASIREHTDEELRQLCDELTRESFEFKARKGIGDSSEHPLKIRTMRRDLARFKTVMRERGIRDHG